MKLGLFVSVLSVIASIGEAKFDKKFHLITTTKANWHEALHYCNSHGWRLAAVFSKEENDQLLKQIRESGIADSFWFAATNKGNEPNFYWMGHEKPMTFTNWDTDSNEPNNISGDEDCIVLLHNANFKWHDWSCNHDYFPVCEEKISTLPGEDTLHDILNIRSGKL